MMIMLAGLLVAMSAFSAASIATSPTSILMTPTRFPRFH